MALGRPAKYATPEEMETAINSYFQNTEIERQTITGLALYLGFVDRQSLYDYQEKPDFTCILKRARTMVENSYELTLRDKEHATGSIFALKNMGWRDKTEVDQNMSIQGKPTINLVIPDGLTID